MQRHGCPAVPLARRLAGALEPIAGQAQFSPECHRNYEALGFPPSPGMVGRTAVPDKCGFFTGRGSVLGDVPAEVVAAAFAVFNPDEIVPLVRRGQALADAATMWAARLDGAAAQLRRILGPEPARMGWVADRLLAAADDLPLAGRAFFAAQRGAAIPDDPFGRLWRSADRLREFRGDSHIQVWSAAGFDPLEIGLLSDLFWGLAPRAHTAGRGWSEEQLAAGEERLRAAACSTPTVSPSGAAPCAATSRTAPTPRWRRRWRCSATTSMNCWPRSSRGVRRSATPAATSPRSCGSRSQPDDEGPDVAPQRARLIGWCGPTCIVRRAATGSATPSVAVRPGAHPGHVARLGPAAVLGLQRLAGNRAVTPVVQRACAPYERGERARAASPAGVLGADVSLAGGHDIDSAGVTRSSSPTSRSAARSCGRRRWTRCDRRIGILERQSDGVRVRRLLRLRR